MSDLAALQAEHDRLIDESWHAPDPAWLERAARHEQNVRLFAREHGQAHEHAERSISAPWVERMTGEERYQRLLAALGRFAGHRLPHQDLSDPDLVELAVRVAGPREHHWCQPRKP